MRDILRNRNHRGELFLVQESSSDPEYHYKYFRILKERFDELYGRIKNKLHHKPNHILPIGSLQRLAITLRYLATGASQDSVAMSCRVSPSSVSKIVRETCTAIWTTFQQELLPVPTEEMWMNISRGFFENWNFPHCVGSIDGKHVNIKCPNKSGSWFFNYKKTFSTVLLELVDHNYLFTMIDIGAAGSQSDGGILKNSEFGKRLESGDLQLPKPEPLSSSDIELPFVFIGDSGFPLKLNLLRPYPRKHLTHSQEIFNYRLSRARRVVENAFGIMAARWRIFFRPVEADIGTAETIVKACVILHNFLTKANDMSALTVDSEDFETGDVIPGNWRNMVANYTGIGTNLRFGTCNHTATASYTRRLFTSYFNSKRGTVAWQGNTSTNVT